MANTYRFVETTPAGTLTIVDAETATHIILYGTAAGFTVAFDAGDHFTVRRLYRLTNMSSQPVTVQNFDASITDTLIAGNVLQATLSDIATEAGDWNLVQHVDRGDYTAADSLLVAQATAETPVNLVLAEQRILGRITGGHVAALTAANVDGIIGSLYAYLSGRAGGQTLKGGTAAGESLTLMSTAHGTKGSILFGTSAYDEVNNRFGIGTAVIPHGGIGAAKFAMDGTNASLLGPHVQFTTAADDYPVFQQINWNHGSQYLLFDSYNDGAYKSSFAGSNHAIIRESNLFSVKYDSGIAPGAAITWNDGIVLDVSGNVGVGLTAWGTNAAKVFGLASGTAPTTSPADAVQLYSADLAGVAASAALHVRTESGAIAAFGKNWLLGDSTAMAANAVSVLQIANGTAPAAHVDNAIQIYSKDTADNTASLALFLEQEDEDIGVTVAGKKLKITLNGNAWYVLGARV